MLTRSAPRTPIQCISLNLQRLRYISSRRNLIAFPEIINLLGGSGNIARSILLHFINSPRHSFLAQLRYATSSSEEVISLQATDFVRLDAFHCPSAGLSLFNVFSDRHHGGVSARFFDV